MIGRWRFAEHHVLILTFMLFLVYQNCVLCFSLNDEGMALLRIREKVESDPFGALSNWVYENGINDPCFWSGVECDCGNVVALNLEDMCLGGTLASDLGKLVHIKSILLRNNSLRGYIPNELRELKELEVLDLGYNNFSGSLPYGLGNNISLAILLLDHNDFLSTTSPEFDELKRISVIVKRASPTKRSLLWAFPQIVDANRKLLQDPVTQSPSASSSSSPSPSPSPSPAPSPLPSPSPSPLPLPSPSPSPSNHPSISVNNPKKINHQALVLSAAIGAPLLLLFIFAVFFFGKGGRMASVRPWTTGLSGQLQKVFVTGVPKLKRSELEAACEDFSNLIGSSSFGTLYKGTLSNGVEIAVAAVAVGTAKDWSQNMETQFRKKIDMLSKMNHKNFGNLLGFCEDNEPFTRMLVFEYAPNGTLFEHLHIAEAEHLDWGMRMRIIMGMAYCLDYMHNLTPPISHKNLISSSIYLTEDYAAKVSDFSFWSDVAAAEMETNPENNVYDFGVMLFEIITGRLPYSDGGPLEDWASDFMRGGKQPLSKIVDSTLQSFEAETLEQIGEVIRSCVYHEPGLRPKIRQVTSRLREIINIIPGDATPKLSPLWWAELEILAN